VLNDASKRRMYDQGMDLEEMQNGGGGHGHGHGGMGGIDPSVLFSMFGGGGGGGGRRGGGGFPGGMRFG
jgi:DnaJ family protein C protein 7